MRKMKLLIPATALAAAFGIAASMQDGEASDHDDGQADLKGQALNLTDHFAFKSPANPNELSMIMYFNPRSLPGRQYTMSPNARYELHVSKAATPTSGPTAKDDYVFRFEAGAPKADGTQSVTMTILKDGQPIGSHQGSTTAFASSKSSAITTNSGTAGGIDFKYFIGMRADSFHFDVIRFFQVRAFLADRFFGGANGDGNANASLGPNCRGDAFLAPLLNGGAGETQPSDGDLVNLFNPPSCAPDFTKNYNVTAIVLNVPISQLGGGTIFDTWSTISVGE
jgi:hypothetical protein